MARRRLPPATALWQQFVVEQLKLLSDGVVDALFRVWALAHFRYIVSAFHITCAVSAILFYVVCSWASLGLAVTILGFTWTYSVSQVFGGRIWLPILGVALVFPEVSVLVRKAYGMITSQRPTDSI
jgi:hypothetical protein